METLHRAVDVRIVPRMHGIMVRRLAADQNRGDDRHTSTQSMQDLPAISCSSPQMRKARARHTDVMDC
ncbi:hypothetical protein N7492_003791 [Penicillium capsulatum]|uniref:Uncharacterized protein n=1 Tax=Penicillium capsulatum TaxID=69766 RepID=A0A9W9LWE7_9EURO|nr:hypothetical protein N7492_003791 [Penicillium capsulatum]KAJ6121625.1 hypothetical protein N7512_004090 [Penicillium capsulatum]